MNYLIQFPLPNNKPRFLGPNDTVTDKLTEALIFPSAQVAGLYLDNYLENNVNEQAVIIRPTGL